MRNYNHCGSSDKIWAQEGRLFRQKVVIFGLVSFIDPLHQKLAKA